MRHREREADRVIGARIRAARMALGLSQQALGDELELTFQQIQKYEKGSNSIASTRIAQLCGLLQITPNQLLTPERSEVDELVVSLDAGAIKLMHDVSNLSPKQVQLVRMFVDALLSARVKRHE